MWWLLLGAATRAEMRLQDPSRCVDAEAVDLEVRGSLGDPAVDGLDIFVRVVPDGVVRTVEIRVSNVRGGLLWERGLAGEARDCALLTELVARSIEAGIEEVPGWRLMAERGRSRPEGAMYAQMTLPWTLRAGFGGGTKVQWVGPLWWGFDADAYLSARERTGLGTLQTGGLGFASGPLFRVRLGDQAVDVGARAWLGLYGVSGRGFDANYLRVFPRVTVNPEVTFVARRWLRVGLRVEVPTVRVRATAPGEETGVREPEVRAGLSLGFGRPLRGSEGAESDRP